nr:hypothetical protein Itr_chr11CG14690 [Ipomoea trifida]
MCILLLYLFYWLVENEMRMRIVPLERGENIPVEPEIYGRGNQRREPLVSPVLVSASVRKLEQTYSGFRTDAETSSGFRNGAEIGNSAPLRKPVRFPAPVRKFRTGAGNRTILELVSAPVLKPNQFWFPKETRTGKKKI